MSVFNPPDWRDASAYPVKADDLSLSQWAWEFLRRNPDYQKDYEHFDGLPSYHPNGSKTCKWHACRANWWDDPELRYCKQSLLPDEDTIAEYFHRTKDNTPFYYSLEDHLIEKWGFSYSEIYDPAYDGGYGGFDSEYELPKVLHIYDSETCPELSPSRSVKPDNMFEVTLRFDCRYSIEKQLKEAKEILLQNREGLIKHSLFPDLKNEIVKDSKSIQINKLSFYLRAYDGKQSGATLIDIRKTIFRGTEENADKQKADRAYENALRLVHGDYRELIDSV